MRKMMNKVILMIIISFVLPGCYDKDKSSDVKPKEERLINFPKKVFGIEIGKLTANEVVQILNQRCIKYTIYRYEDYPKVPNIETTYFIGTGIRREAIQKVTYDFNPFSGKNDKPDISINIKSEYFELVLKDLIKLFGEPTRKDIDTIELKDKNGNRTKTVKELNYWWKSSEKSESTLDFITLTRELNEDSDCYILMRPKDFGCDHVH